MSPASTQTSGEEGVSAQGKSRRTGTRDVVDLVQASGAVLVVSIALAAIFVLTLVLTTKVGPKDKATLVTSAFTVIGTLVGAYTGAKLGSAGREEATVARDRAEAERQDEATTVSALAARLEPDEAREALKTADQIRQHRRRAR